MLNILKMEERKYTNTLTFVMYHVAYSNIKKEVVSKQHFVNTVHQLNISLSTVTNRFDSGVTE